MDGDLAAVWTPVTNVQVVIILEYGIPYIVGRVAMRSVGVAMDGVADLSFLQFWPLDTTCSSLPNEGTLFCSGRYI